VIAIATLAGLMQFLESSEDQNLQQYRLAVEAYRSRWGVS